MNILNISLAYPSDHPNSVNGIHVHRQNIYLSQKGCNIRVINPVMFPLRITDSYSPFSSRKDGIEIWRPHLLWIPKLFRAGTYYSDYFYKLSTTKTAINIVSNWQPDVIICDWMVPGARGAAEIARELGIPLIVKIHGVDMRLISTALKGYYAKYRRAYLIQLVESISKVICNGDGLYNEMIGTGLFDARKVVNIPIGVDNKIFHPIQSKKRLELRIKLNIPALSPVVIFVGGWRQEKGARELASIIPKILDDYPLIHFLIVGKIIDQASYQKLSAYKQVQFTGQIPPDQVQAFMKAADMFILPSHKEGLPSALLEAMACGLVPIVTRVGGVPGVVKNGVNGCLLDIGDKDTLEANIIQCIEDVEFRKNIAEAAVNTIHDIGYDLESVAVSLFDEIVSVVTNYRKHA